MSKDEYTKESREFLDQISTIIWGLILLTSLATGMLIVHLGLSFFFHT